MARKERSKSEKIATLTAEEELELLKVAKFESGKRKSSALKSLIYHNLNLVKHIVKGFWTYYGEQGEDNREELLSEGVMAIPKAVEKFDINSKNRFATYAGYWIKQFIQSAASKNQILNQSNNNNEFAFEKNKEENEDEKKTGKFVKQKYKLVYYDKKYPGSSSGDSKSYSLIDIISDKKDNVEEQIKREDLKIHSNKMISTLESLEDLVIRLYFAIVPLNISHIRKVCDEKEREEIDSLMKKKFFKKKETYDVPLEELKSNKIVRKYINLFSEQHKTREIAEIISKADGVVRKLKQKAIKKMRIFGNKHGLENLV